MRWSGVCLAAAVWMSSLLFSMYILAAYIGDWVTHELAHWNDALPGLYDVRTPIATSAMGAHIIAGSILLTLGFIQLVAPLRNRFPVVHHWIGRIYIVAALAAGVGGLTYVFDKGTIGGLPMNIGFGLYGALVILAAVQAYRYARARDIQHHRAWAIRLFAIVIASWLYRMDYGFWLITTHGAFHTDDFRGPFDVFMAFWFYLPNLVVAQWFIRAERRAPSAAVASSAVAVCVLCAIVVGVGTYYFTKFYWGPAILGRLAI